MSNVRTDELMHMDMDARRLGYNPEFLKRVNAQRRAEQKERERTLRKAPAQKRERQPVMVPRPRYARHSEAWQKALNEANELIRMGREAAHRLRLLENSSAGYRPSLDTIERRICRALNVTRQDIRSDHRSRSIVLARFAVAYWACRLTRLSTPEIGRRLGGRDHTTILHARNTYPDKRARQGRFLRAVR